MCMDLLIIERKFFLKEFQGLSYYCDKPWYIGGDFNMIRWSSERSSGGRITKSMRKLMVSLMSLI